MSRAVAVSLVAGLWAVFTAVLLWPGALSITKHTGDALHMVAIVERMAQGQVPHLDFVTPIGALAFWPIAVFVEAGAEVGAAFLRAQVLVGALLGLLALYVAGRRVSWRAAAAFGAMVVILAMALVHGEPDIAVSVSMHYNRWAWGLAFIVVLMACLPVERSGADGVILGALMAALLLIKVTYFAALAPLVILGLLLTGQRATLALGLIVGLCIVAALTLVLGLGFWQAYLGDLLAVAGSDVRARPGVAFAEVLTGPAFLMGTGLSLAMVVVLRRAGFESEGILVLLLFGAGAYITYQNFGNDPKWFALFAFLLAAWAREAPRTGSARPALIAASVALAALIAPSFINMAVSPFRHAGIDRAAYMPALVGGTRHQDLYVSKFKGNRVRSDTPLGGVRGFEAPEPQPPIVFRGQTLADCRTDATAGYFASIAADLREAGLAQGASVYMMDILNPLWLYGDHRPLEGGTPWHYSGTPGFEDAEFVLLPHCALIVPVRNQIAESLQGAEMTEVARTERFTLYAR
ncbi:MAG: hypothetical protein AAFZ02_01015 [Pseudomonadota bacterium]